MGICTSCSSATESTAAAKLILPNGALEEYSSPVRVSFLLSKHQGVFICSSDDMEFDACLTALRDTQELQLGELYFALPLSKLGRRLPAEEMAALAVTANAALLVGGGGGDKYSGCRSKKSGFFDGEKKKSSSKVADLGSATVKSEGKVVIRNSGRNKGRMYFANLSVIPE